MLQKIKTIFLLFVVLHILMIMLSIVWWLGYEFVTWSQVDPIDFINWSMIRFFSFLSLITSLSTLLKDG